MAGIDDIGNGSSGSFDFERSIEEKDTRVLTKGSKGSAGDDPRIGDTIPTAAERNQQRAEEAGLAGPKFDIADRIYKDEALPDDSADRENMSTYFEKSTKTRNIGPGLNLDSPLVQKALKTRGFDASKFSEIYDFEANETIDSELVPMMNEVFTEVIGMAREDVKSLVGGGKNWNTLKQHERDALTQMSYNLGKGKLGGFTNTLGAISLLIKKRQGGKGMADEADILQVIADEMEDSTWFNQVGNRAVRIISQFSAGNNEAALRFKKGLEDAN